MSTEVSKEDLQAQFASGAINFEELVALVVWICCQISVVEICCFLVVLYVAGEAQISQSDFLPSVQQASQKASKDGESAHTKKTELHATYKSGAEEGKTVDSINAVERIVKNLIYPKIKFLSDDDTVYETPDFTGLGPKTQSVAICEKILTALDRPNETMKAKTMWWVAYRKIIRKKITRLRLADVYGIKKAFKEGKLDELLSLPVLLPTVCLLFPLKLYCMSRRS